MMINLDQTAKLQVSCHPVNHINDDVVQIQDFIYSKFFLPAPCRGRESQDVCGTIQFNFTNCATLFQ